MDLAGLEPDSSACDADALPLDDRPMVAGVGIAPTCLAYEARLDLSPANPRWLQRQDSNLHVTAYETALEPFQARCSAFGGEHAVRAADEPPRAGRREQRR